jgi:predicted Rossmann fold nucleotide-binding protein DprA/Smf involved in DNA uptake
MSGKAEAKQRTEMLKRLRTEHEETVERTQARLKEQKAVRKQICQVMRDGPKTVPEVAEESGLPAHEVLWHITAMKKYDLVTEVGQCGEYYQYAMAEEAKS